MAHMHLAYRGNPDNPHLKVISATSSAAVLSNCPTPATVNPSVQYNVRDRQAGQDALAAALTGKRSRS